eukprot:4474267-Pleurochrysis_carterae.AAC.2
MIGNPCRQSETQAASAARKLVEMSPCCEREGRAATNRSYGPRIQCLNAGGRTCDDMSLPKGEGCLVL